MDKTVFQQQLYKWHKDIDRKMPWKVKPTPYKVWVSEIILQQTRVVQGTPYYNAFIKNFPTVKELANATEDEVLKTWQGLGYYSRARNMHKAAQKVAYTLNGVFPETYEALLELPGVGPYSAAAIASFAYNLPHAVLDGNVFRVYSRLLNDHTPTNSAGAKKHYTKIADTFFDTANPAAFNQAIMDFGAIQCVPKSPDCGTCPLSRVCKAYQAKEQHLLPIKLAKKPKVKRYFNYAILRDDYGRVLIQKRTHRDVWQHLYEFNLHEAEASFSKQDFEKLYPNAEAVHFHSIPSKQTLSHQIIISTFCEIRLKNLQATGDQQLVPFKNIENFAFPKTITKYLEAEKTTLGL